MPQRLPSHRRGSTLIITVILLAVLAVVGAAAISLSARERINSASVSKRDRLAACAQAARLSVWAELAKYGGGYFESTNAISGIALPDGTTLAAPAHYSQDMTMKVKDVVIKNQIGCGAGGNRVDLTNTFHAPKTNCDSDAYVVVARCTDASGNQFEIEFVTGLAL